MNLFLFCDAAAAYHRGGHRPWMRVTDTAAGWLRRWWPTTSCSQLCWLSGGRETSGRGGGSRGGRAELVAACVDGAEVKHGGKVACECEELVMFFFCF